MLNITDYITKMKNTILLAERAVSKCRNGGDYFTAFTQLNKWRDIYFSPLTNSNGFFLLMIAEMTDRQCC